MKILSSVLSACLLAFTLTPAQAFETLQTRTALKSVHFLELEKADTVSVQLMVHMGEADLEGPEGMAHYLEHLVHWHSEGGYKPGFSAHRANAYTSNRVTNFWRDAPAKDAETAFRKLARVFQTPDLPRDFMRRERDVVTREYDLRMRENPYGRFGTKLGKLLYQSNPVARSVIGTPQSIGSLTIEEAFETHKRFYRAANASLVIVGKIDQATAVRFVEKHFSGLPRGDAQARPWRSRFPAGTEQVKLLEADSQVEGPSVFIRKLVRLDEALDGAQVLRLSRLMTKFLSSSLPGSLASPLRYDNALANQYWVRISVLADSVLELAFWAKPEAGISLTELSDAYRDALRKLARDGLPEASVHRLIKRAAKAHLRLADNMNQQSKNAALWLLHDLEPVSAASDIAGIKDVSKADFDRLARAMARPGRSVVGHLMPK